MKESIVLSLILCFMILMLYLATLSIRISRKREKVKYEGFLSDVFFKLISSGWISIHIAPIPYYGVSDDDAETQLLVRKRNLFVVLFWLTFVTIFLIAFLF